MSEARVVHDDLGRAVRLNQPVARVVSLVPSLTEAIADSCPGLLVGATAWCTHPADLDVQRVKGTKNPDIDAIIELRPDFVVANHEENREVDVAALEAAGISVWVTRITTVAESLDSMERLLTIGCGLTNPPGWLQQARALWQVPPPALRRSAAVAIWRKPWMVVGSGTFTGDVLARLGISNVFAESPERYPKVTVDEIVSRQPDLVVLPDEPYLFTADDGPESFPGFACALVSGRLLTWYGPSLVAAHGELSAALGASH